MVTSILNELYPSQISSESHSLQETDQEACKNASHLLWIYLGKSFCNKTYEDKIFGGKSLSTFLSVLGLIQISSFQLLLLRTLAGKSRDRTD